LAKCRDKYFIAFFLIKGSMSWALFNSKREIYSGEVLLAAAT
jgi:hypothetical protein